MAARARGGAHGGEAVEAVEVATAALPASVATRAAYFLGEEGVAGLSPEQALAFTGLLEASRRLTRELEGELEAVHGLSFSALGLLGRMAAAERGTLRLTLLARDMGLSLSRVSRVVDTLEGRGLLVREQCPADARATNAHLTAAGLALAREAQATHRAGVQRRFFAKLSPAQIAVLAAAFTSLLDCTGPSRILDKQTSHRL
ncbi:MAG TPA: MarR family transcriptional regulator [Solirubrobacteraceae bacterium]|jgi:DNA-binding MarR family transcriptional regulator|nr:MarR family transcriptional regulator [Solirubrobacteraceae bacterium]